MILSDYFTSSLEEKWLVLEEIGFSRCQDDTIVDLRSNFEVFSPMEQLNYSLAKNIEDIDNEFINIFNKLFSKNGLVVIDIMDFELRNFFYEKLKNFYFKNLEVNKNNKIHFVYSVIKTYRFNSKFWIYLSRYQCLHLRLSCFTW